MAFILQRHIAETLAYKMTCKCKGLNFKAKIKNLTKFKIIKMGEKYVIYEVVISKTDA